VILGSLDELPYRKNLLFCESTITEILASFSRKKTTIVWSLFFAKNEAKKNYYYCQS
jgi:hypothetical protein